MKKLFLGALVGLILMASHTHLNAGTVRWAGIDWVYDETSTNASVQGDKLLISNPDPERISRGGVFTPRGFFDPDIEMDQFVEVTFIDPYSGSGDDSMFYLVAKLAPAIASHFGIRTKGADRYSIQVYRDHQKDWYLPRASDRHTIAMYYSIIDNSIRYYFDGLEVYHRETTNDSVFYDIDSLGLAVLYTPYEHPFIFTDLRISYFPPTDDCGRKID